jgi:hypothetical protein
VDLHIPASQADIQSDNHIRDRLGQSGPFGRVERCYRYFLQRDPGLGDRIRRAGWGVVVVYK